MKKFIFISISFLALHLNSFAEEQTIQYPIIIKCDSNQKCIIIQPDDKPVRKCPNIEISKSLGCLKK